MRELLEKLVEQMVDRGILFEEARHEFERRFMARVLDRCDGNLSRAAERLGMHRNTLTRKLNDHRTKKA